jgi:Recombinase
MKLFDLVASRQHRPNDALNEVTALGLRTRRGNRVPPETLAHILRNSIYCGIAESKKWGISVQGDFEPLVPREVFDEVQQVISRRSYAEHETPRRPDEGAQSGLSILQ